MIPKEAHHEPDIFSPHRRAVAPAALQFRSGVLPDRHLRRQHWHGGHRCAAAPDGADLEQDAARKVYDALKSQFETEYNATAVPADVYLDALSADWLEDAMKQQVTDSYQNPADKTVPDFSALEQSITDYFERYAAENHCEKDSTYDTKLAQTIQNAEHTIQDALMSTSWTR
ncbi:MAG: hypothetical protein ACLT3Y_04440 [Ruminococcus callidus]